MRNKRNKRKLPFTKEEILQKFDYKKDLGVLIWKDCKSRDNRNGRVAGCVKGGYYYILINKKNYLAHRLIWFIEKGTQPEMIDHINGNPSDNRIENLRESRNSLNQQNRHTHRSGRLVGAHYHKGNKKWSSHIRVNGKILYLGVFENELQAHQAYKAKFNELNAEIETAKGQVV